jgi:hypothetical protein
VSLPWFLILISIVFVFGLEMLIRRYSFVFRGLHGPALVYRVPYGFCLLLIIDLNYLGRKIVLGDYCYRPDCCRLAYNSLCIVGCVINKSYARHFDPVCQNRTSCSRFLNRCLY